jgi:hypothetical protein
MRTSLDEIKEVDDQLLKLQQPDDALLFQAKLLIYPELKDEVMLHNQTLRLVQQYGHNHLRAQIAAVHRQLFTLQQHQSFREKVLRFFKR